MKQGETTNSPEQTIELGARLAADIGPGDIICLQGPLGAGKTHFVKGLAEGLGISQEEVQSPTYTLIHEYEGRLPLYHFDCYRMESPREALEIGAEEYFYGSGICVIEWPDRISSLIPDEAMWITIEEIDRNSRKFVIGQKA